MFPPTDYWSPPKKMSFPLSLKLAFFIKFLFFTKWSPFINYEKCFSLHLKRFFRSRDIQIFVFPSSLLFLPVSHCFRGCSKMNLKAYDVINCLEKEKRCNNETLSIDRVLNTEHFYGKVMLKMCTKR